MYALVLAVPVNVSWANPTSEPAQASLGRSWTLLTPFELRYERRTQNMLVHIVTGHPTEFQEGHREKSESGDDLNLSAIWS